MTEKKISSVKTLRKVLGRLRKRGKKVIFTNGTFDILHAGHVTYLEKARAFGDLLVVGVNSDRSVKAYKSPDRPINPQGDRMRVLAALSCVDFVVLFEDPTPLRLILELRPDVLVKGADWKKEQIAGAREVESWGGRVRRVKMLAGRSTTRIIERMRG